MVTVYSAENCKYCKLAKLFLQANKVDFEYKNIDTNVVEKHCCGEVETYEDTDFKADFDKLDAMGAPVLVVDGEVFFGFTPDIQRAVAEKLGL
jgi:glutaredoxin